MIVIAVVLYIITIFLLIVGLIKYIKQVNWILAL